MQITFLFLLICKSLMMMMVIVIMIMMAMINFFEEYLTVERSSPPQISNKLREVFETAKNLSLDIDEQSSPVLMTNTPWC